MPTRRVVVYRAELSLFSFFSFAFTISAAGAQVPARSDCPRGNLPAYAHNDYLNAHPLSDALSLGYRGAEADVFLVNGVLQLGHERRAAAQDGTFETLYLAPLRALVARCGPLTTDGQPFLLTLEIKEASRPTFDTLVAVLARYTDLFSERNGQGAVHGGPAVQPVLVGWYPPGFADTISIPLTRQARIQHAGKPPADAGDRTVGLISLDYSETIGRRWTTAAQRRHWLAAIRATKAAFPERRIRVYHVPVKDRIYRDLLSAGVDLIGTTELDATARLLDGNAVPDKRP
jgi:hypothetical protein